MKWNAFNNVLSLSYVIITYLAPLVNKSDTRQKESWFPHFYQLFSLYTIIIHYLNSLKAQMVLSCQFHGITLSTLNTCTVWILNRKNEINYQIIVLNLHDGWQIFAGRISWCVVFQEEQSKMASSQFGANTAGEWRQKGCLNLFGLRGISSPLFRESLIDTWGLAWRTEDNASIVSLFSESRRPSTAVSLQGAWLASKLELSLLIFADASPGFFACGSGGHVGEHQLWYFFSQNQ